MAVEVAALEAAMSEIREIEGGIVHLRTDAAIAQELRDKLNPLLDQVCGIMAQAKADGLMVSWNLQPDSFGRKFKVTEISIVKPL